MNDIEQRILALEAEIKKRDQRIEELASEVKELRAVMQRMQTKFQREDWQQPSDDHNITRRA